MMGHKTRYMKWEWKNQQWLSGIKTDRLALTKNGEFEGGALIFIVL